MQEDGPLAARRWKVRGEGRRGPRLWELGRGDWCNVEGCAYSRRLARLGLVWWADLTNDNGVFETVPAMEKRTGKKWGVGERADYARLQMQLRARYGEGGALAAWEARCEALRRGGHGPESDVRADQGAGGGAGKMASIGKARRAPACWGGWEYQVEWDDGKTTWEKARGMVRTPAIEKECREARQSRKAVNSFADVVKGDERLRRACGCGGGDPSEEDMCETWRAFVRYADEGRAEGEMPRANMEECVREQGKRSRVVWSVGSEQRAFYGGQEPDESGKPGKKGKKGKVPSGAARMGMEKGRRAREAAEAADARAAARTDACRAAADAAAAVAGGDEGWDDEEGLEWDASAGGDFDADVEEAMARGAPVEGEWERDEAAQREMEGCVGGSAAGPPVAGPSGRTAWEGVEGDRQRRQRQQRLGDTLMGGGCMEGDRGGVASSSVEDDGAGCFDTAWLESDQAGAGAVRDARAAQGVAAGTATAGTPVQGHAPRRSPQQQGAAHRRVGSAEWMEHLTQGDGSDGYEGGGWTVGEDGRGKKRNDRARKYKDRKASGRRPTWRSSDGEAGVEELRRVLERAAERVRADGEARRSYMEGLAGKRGRAASAQTGCAGAPAGAGPSRPVRWAHDAARLRAAEQGATGVGGGVASRVARMAARTTGAPKRENAYDPQPRQGRVASVADVPGDVGKPGLTRQAQDAAPMERAAQGSTRKGGGKMNVARMAVRTAGVIVREAQREVEGCVEGSTAGPPAREGASGAGAVSAAEGVAGTARAAVRTAAACFLACFITQT